MDGVRTPRGAVGLLAAIAVLVAGCASGGGERGAPAVRPSVAAPPPSSAVPQPGHDAVPESLLLPDEGERSSVAEFTDWITDPALDREWLLDPCRPTAYPTDRQRVRFRTVSRTGPEAHDARQLGVYPTAEVAAEVLAGFRRVLEACRTGRVEGAHWTWLMRDVPGLGEDGFVAASAFRGPTYASHGDRVAVTRVGNAVFLAYASGEFFTAEFDGGAEAVQQVAQRFLDSL